LTPDIVLMDIVLSGETDGIEAAALLLGKGFPVIFTTAHSSEQMMAQALETLPYGYLVKPIDVREMLVTVSLSIKRHRLERELKEKEAELSRSREKYRQLVNSASDTIWITDRDGFLTFANPATARVTEYDRDELVGMNIFQLVEPSQRESLQRIHIDQFKKRIPEIFTEVRIQTKTGRHIWLGQYVQIVWLDGRIAGFQAIGRDITETKSKEREMEIARAVNDAIMRRSPGTEHISSLYHPMRMIGGDIIDFLRFRDPDTIGVFIGDVSGHGVPAALVAAMLKGVINQSGDSRSDPSRFLLYLNDCMFDTTGGYFITALYGIFTVSTGRFAFSAAGHPPPVLVRGDDASFYDMPGSVPLGIMTTADLLDFDKGYAAHAIDIRAGETLLLYTDGLYEACPANGDGSPQFGERALLDTLRAARGLPGTELIRAVLDTAVAHRGSDQFDDDVSMICIEG
ncbi:MAG TPA: SpoIIE family protein phosphatase, partial [Spirochaetota bacterium]|nr:SpoIIE family protein phosphatase [Spirochaetota bacterium]